MPRGENAGLPLELPPAKIDALVKGIPESDFVDLVVDASGGIQVGGKKTDSKDVVKAIEYQRYRNPRLIVHIETSEKTKYRDFLTVLEQAKEAGAQRY